MELKSALELQFKGILMKCAIKYPITEHGQNYKRDHLGPKLRDATHKQLYSLPTPTQSLS